jgi:hypothetical protein
MAMSVTVVCDIFLIDLVKKGPGIPTIAIIGGGTGGNLLAARPL